jgi:hypothetical protein
MVPPVVVVVVPRVVVVVVPRVVVVVVPRVVVLPVVAVSRVVEVVPVDLVREVHSGASEHNHLWPIGARRPECRAVGSR